MAKAQRKFQYMCLVSALAAGLSAAPAAAQSVIDEWDSVKAPPPPALRAVTVDPKKTAYMVLDFRREVCTPQRRARCAAALPKVAKLLEQARAKGMFVVHTTTSSGKPEDIPAELAPREGEPVLNTTMDKLSNTDMPDRFKAMGIDTVMISGTSANGAVLNTVTGAAMRGFKVIVPVDTMPAETPYQEQFVVWQIANGSTLRDRGTLTRSDMIKF